MKQIAGCWRRKNTSAYSESYKFKDLPKAHQQIESGITMGKVVAVL